ncbi:GTPase [Nonomuraea dietziae]|uniref:GTPase n=1 Tax=Nonomuraea dietziae TaxID=65515 RepID=UPI00341D2CB1
MRSAGDAPESVGEQTLNFRAIRDDDDPDRVADESEAVRRAEPSSDPEAEPAGDFFAFARPASHDRPRAGDTEDDLDDPDTLDPEPAFETLEPTSAEPSDDFAPFGRPDDTFRPFGESAPARDSFTPYRAAEPPVDNFTPFRSSGLRPPAAAAPSPAPPSAAGPSPAPSAHEEPRPEATDVPWATSGVRGGEAGDPEAVVDFEVIDTDDAEGDDLEDLAHDAEPGSAEPGSAKTEDTGADSAETDSAESGSAETNGAGTGNAEADGTETDGTEADGTGGSAEADGTGADGAEADGTGTDTAEPDGSVIEGATTPGTTTGGSAPHGATADGSEADVELEGATADDPETDTGLEGATADDPETGGGVEGAGGGVEPGDAVTGEPAVPGQLVEVDLPDAAAQALTTALDALKEAVADLRFGLDLPGSEEARQAQEEILTQLRDYVLPRVRVSAAPALIVIAGSTGAGKSTLVNTLAEKNVSRTGVRRPTTGIPVLACHPDDRGWFAGSDLLGGLERIERQSREAAPDSLVLVTTERLPQGVALLDTPDIDSVVEEHHEIARRMLDAADLWVFVTTASRYADAPAWNLLRLAKERAARIAIVLSRVQPKTRDVVVKHFVRMLTEYGLGEVERFVIEESAVADGRLPDGEMTELRMWLAELSVDEERRAQAVQETLNGVLNSFRTRVPALARYLEGQVAFRGELRTDVDAAYSGALAHIESAVREGTLLRGEVRARWQDFAGSGDLTRSFQLRKKRRPVPPERITAFRAALRTALESLITSAAHQAADEVAARWRRRSELAAGLDRPSDDLARRTGRAVAAWQEYVTELLSTDGVTKRSLSKVVSLDTESLSLLFMVGLFSPDELPQKLLKGLLGAEALRSISAKALSDLRARIVMLFDEEAMRYVRALDAAGIPDEAAATRLYQATYNLEVAR